jgi:hypothetical protein
LAILQAVAAIAPSRTRIDSRHKSIWGVVPRSRRLPTKAGAGGRLRLWLLRRKLRRRRRSQSELPATR